MDTSIIFENFVKTLEAYATDAGDSFQPYSLSEDTICLFLAASFWVSGVPAHKVHMEVPHPALGKPKGVQKCVDFRVADPQGNLWIEVKFDRASQSGSQLNETNRFGSLLRDFIRAGLVSAKEGIVFYVTDLNMKRYLENKHPQFCGLAPFSVDSDFVERLPASAASRIDPVLASAFSGTSLTFQLIWQRSTKHFSCFAWKTV